MLQRRGNRLELYRHRTWGAFVDSGFDSGLPSGLPKGSRCRVSYAPAIRQVANPSSVVPNVIFDSLLRATCLARHPASSIARVSSLLDALSGEDLSPHAHDAALDL
jgi:hypothetical protein